MLASLPSALMPPSVISCPKPELIPWLPDPALVIVGVVVLDPEALEEFPGLLAVEPPARHVRLVVGVEVLVDAPGREAGARVGLSGHDQHVGEPERLERFLKGRGRFRRHPAADTDDLLQFDPPRRVRLALRQPVGFVCVTSGKGDGGFAAGDERAQEVAPGRVGLPGPHLLHFGGDAAEAQSQDLRVAGDQVAGDGAAVAGAGVVQLPRLLSPAADALLPAAGLRPRVGL